MTISRRLLLAVLAPTLMALVAIVGLVISYDVVGRLQQDQSLARRITDGTNELTDLARSYVLTRADRPRLQYSAEARRVESLLAEAQQMRDPYREQFVPITDDVSVAGSLFGRLVAARDGTSSIPPSVAGEAEQLLSGQLFIRLRDATGRESAVSAAINADIVATQRRVYLLTGLVTFLAVTFLTIALLVLRRSVTRSLGALREGTERIGSGDLSYRIGMTSRDELGDLGRSFDLMSERLQSVTVSKDDLEREVRERMRVEDELRASLQTTGLLLRAADTLSSWTNLHDVAQELADLLIQVTRHTRAIVDIYDAGSNELVVAGCAGRDVFPVGSRWRLDQLSSAVQEVMAEGRTRVADVGALPADERGIAADAYHLRRMLYVPLVQRDETVGLVALDDPGERREFTEGEIHLVEGIATQAAVAIENARLFDGERTGRRRIEALHGVMEAGAESLEVRPSAEKMLEYLAGHETFDIMTLWLASADALELIASAHLPPAYGERVSPMPVSSPFDIAKVYQTGEPLTVPDVAEGNPSVRELYESLGVVLGAYVVVPVRVRAKTIGSLSMGWREPRTFSAEDIDFYESLGHEIGAVVENSRLFEAERDIAERLQEALLSLPDTVPGIEFADAYHSATEAARVGGDFYDLFELYDGKLGVVIGDVAGKGLDAAVLTSMVKNTLRAHANEPSKAPAEILALTNDVVFKSTATEAFVTVFFGILDRIDGSLAYANAGHTTTAILRPDGGVRGLPATGPLLGAFEGVAFDETAARLDPDELLFLYTDGLTEARRGHELYGEERLFAFLSLLRGGIPAEVVREVIADVISFSGDRLSDDLAILAVKRVEHEAAGEHTVEV